MNNRSLVMLPGVGVGREVVQQTVRVRDWLQSASGFNCFMYVNTIMANKSSSRLARCTDLACWRMH